MNYTWLASLACNARQQKRRKKRSRYTLGSEPPEGYEKTPDGREGSFRKALPGGGFDYWYADEGGTSSAQPAKAETQDTPPFAVDRDTYVEASFEVEGQPFKFRVTQYSKGGAWVVNFTRVKPSGAQSIRQTPMGNPAAAVRVFGVVRRLVTKFIATRMPPRLEFAASSAEPSRVRLYDKLAQQVEGMGYRLKRSVKGGDVVYEFQRKPAEAPPGGKKPWWKWWGKK